MLVNLIVFAIGATYAYGVGTIAWGVEPTLLHLTLFTMVCAIAIAFSLYRLRVVRQTPNPSFFSFISSSDGRSIFPKLVIATSVIFLAIMWFHVLLSSLSITIK